MKKMMIVVFVFMSFSVLAGDARYGLQIMESHEKINSGFKTEKASGVLTIINKRGVKKERGFDFVFKEKNQKKGDKVIFKVTSPADLNGVKVLTQQNLNQDDDQWLFLPGMGKAKRIIGNAITGKFLGSDFTYEDLRSRNINDYTYEWVKIDKQDNFVCDMIIAHPKNIKTQYYKSILWVRQRDLQIVRVDLYKEGNVLAKRTFFNDYKKYKDKFWRAHKVVMKDMLKKTESIMTFKNIKLGEKLGLQDFNL